MNRRVKKKKSRISHDFNFSAFFTKFGFLTLLTLLFALVGYWITMQLFHRFSFQISGADDWNLLGGFVSLLTLSFLIGGILTTVLDRVREDVVEAREQAKLSYDIYRTIYEKLTDPEEEAARRWIITNIQVKKDDQDFASWYAQTQEKIMAREPGRETDLPEGQRAVKMTLNLLDYIGFIAKNYWEIEEDSLDWLGLPIAKIWKRLGPYVMELRRQRNVKDYYLFAEYIGEECVSWRRSQKLPEEEFVTNTL